MPHTYAPRRGHCRVPAFAPVPLRSRAHGWTPMKQAAFLGALAVTGSVRAAALRVGLSRESVYRLRRKPGAQSFARAWDAVLRRPVERARKFTHEEVPVRALHGLLKPLIYAGRHVATTQKADNSALLRMVRQLQRSACGGMDWDEAVGSFVAATASTGRGRAGRQRPFHSGLRFSAKARGPSWASSL